MHTGSISAGLPARVRANSGFEIITWLEGMVAAWNEGPTPFTWGGKRKKRRHRARQRRLGG
jgi:hypothetical protein